MGVTGFFRDPEFFDLLAARIVPGMMEARDPDDPIRVWVPGCSTGEEAYSLAMLLREQAEECNLRVETQIFASDADPAAVAAAHAGLYPGDVAADVTPKRFDRFFRSDGGLCRVREEVRENMVFTLHNVLSDPPFIRQDLINCRNLFTNLSRKTQHKILPLLFHALKPGGTLLLGPSGKAGEHEELFEVVDKRWKVFRRKKATLRQPVCLPVIDRLRQSRSAEEEADRQKAFRPRAIIERELLKLRACPAILVNRKTEVLGQYGELGPYLCVPEDGLCVDLDTIARDHLRVHLRNALQLAEGRGEAVRLQNIRFGRNGDRLCDLAVHPVEEQAGQPLFLILFEEHPAGSISAGGLSAIPPDFHRDDVIRLLEEQLRRPGEQPQSSIVNQGRPREDLRSSNEEPTSLNEELEEVQAVNEELAALNTDLQTRLAELGQVDLSGRRQMVNTAQDITERIWLEKQLAEREELFRALFENFHLPMLVLDMESGAILKANPAAREYYGYDGPTLESMHIGQINVLPPEDIRRNLERAAGQERKRFEFTHRLASGELREVEVASGPVMAAGRRVLFSIVLDIADRKRAESALREREDQMRLFVEHAPAAIAMFDRDMRYLAVSRRWLADLNLPADVLGKNHYDLFPDLPERWKEIHRRCMEGTSARHDNDRFERQNGSVIHLKWEVQPWYAASGKVGGIVIFSEDITERKEAVEILRRKTAEMDALLSSVQDYLYIFDAGGRFMFANRKLLDLWGLSLEEASGRTMRELEYPAEVEAALDTARRSVFRTGRIVTNETRYTSPTGVEGAFENILAPVLNAEGNVVFVAGSSRDISEKARIFRELRQAKERAESADQAKSRFLANMSHELRTPISGIVGAIQVLAGEDVSPRQAELLEVMEHSATALLHTLNDILDLSKSTSQGIELHEEAFDLEALVRNTTKIFAFQAAKKHLTLTVRVARKAKEYFLGDEYRLGQILRNLVSNAVKFTETGGVEVVVDSDGDGPKDAMSLCIAVRDTGPGIPEEQIGSLFVEFRQLDDSYSKKHGGTGLGLAISKHLAEMMGGRIMVESAVGRGATFTLRIALRPVQSCRLQGAADQHFAVTGPLHILAAEDNELNRMFMRAMLEEQGHRVTFACNGTEVLAALRRDKFDLVLMDVQMPGMDGVQTTRAIRSGEDKHLPANIVIIALTAYAMQGDREKFIGAGMNGYIAKPFSMEMFDEALRSVSYSPRDNASDGQATEFDPKTTERLGRMPRKVRTDMVSLYKIQASEKTDAICEAVFQGNRSAAADEAHSLAGAVGILGMSVLRKKLLKLERLLRSDGTPSGEELTALRGALLRSVHDLEALFADTK